MEASEFGSQLLKSFSEFITASPIRSYSPEGIFVRILRKEFQQVIKR
jgi:hypothetical protein